MAVGVTLSAAGQAGLRYADQFADAHPQAVAAAAALLAEHAEAPPEEEGGGRRPGRLAVVRHAYEPAESWGDGAAEEETLALAVGELLAVVGSAEQVDDANARPHAASAPAAFACGAAFAPAAFACGAAFAPTAFACGSHRLKQEGRFSLGQWWSGYKLRPAVSASQSMAAGRGVRGEDVRFCRRCRWPAPARQRAASTVHERSRLACRGLTCPCDLSLLTSPMC